MKIYLTIERDEHARSSHAGARYRIKVRSRPEAPAILSSSHHHQSVAQAKREAQSLLGPLAWADAAKDVPGIVRAAVMIDLPIILSIEDPELNTSGGSDAKR